MLKVVDERRPRLTAGDVEEALVTVTQSSFINLGRWGEWGDAAANKRWRRRYFFILFHLHPKVPKSSTANSANTLSTHPSTTSSHWLPIAVNSYSYHWVFDGGPMEVPCN